jgi:uncharacterized protein (TIGR02466 family)
VNNLNIKMNVISIFPTAIAHIKFPRKLTRAEGKVFSCLEYRKNTGNSTSVNTNILAIKELHDIREFIIAALNGYLQNIYNPINDIEPYITQSWVNLTREAEYHPSHSHQNSFISGVFYLKVDDTDSIRFMRSNTSAIYLHPKEFNDFNSGSWRVPVEELSLLIFPSDLVHEVPVKLSRHDRVSLSFNSFVKGIFGQDDMLTELELK